MLRKIFKKKEKESKKVWRVGYDDPAIHYAETVKMFDDYNDAVNYKNEMEKKYKLVDWYVL